jgi:hypothetical protein
MSLFDVSLTRKMAQMAKQAYYLQLAVDGGHLELCRFLLQNCTLFNHSNILDGARRSLFQHAALATCDPSVPRFIEEVIDLLATEDDGDVSTGLEYLAALGLYESFRLHQPLLAVIEIPNAEIPLAQRFELAIMSYDWHPDFFTSMSGPWSLSEPTEQGRRHSIGPLQRMDVGRPRAGAKSGRTIIICADPLRESQSAPRILSSNLSGTVRTFTHAGAITHQGVTLIGVLCRPFWMA